MRILNIHTSYNELRLLQYKYEYCKHYGLDLFVIDNMSDDGTAEFLKENNIPHTFLDTKGAFDLRPLLAETNKWLHDLKPDWFIYSSVDMFYESEEGITEDVRNAESLGYAAIKTDTYSIRYTGGDITDGNPFKENTFATKGLTYNFIAKYSPQISIEADFVKGITGNILNGGVFFEIHATKTPEERKKVYDRRKLAWERGMNKDWGVHYTAFDKINWTFKKEDCIDLNTNPLYRKLGNLFEHASVSNIF